MFRPRADLTPRVVLWFVEHLPEDSATAAAIRGGPQFRSWTTQTYLQMLIANTLYAANRQRANKPTRTPLVKPPKRAASRARVVDLKAVKARQDAARARESRS